ncbi:MAG: substrate-binding domain-containing protein [Fimbriimonadales bacterium]|nr:substrate-binding domain-containing protein [Fimbriimonadales bacterium]
MQTERLSQKGGARPAHAQIREAILEQVRSGALRPGERLPSEPEIAERFGVSRMTANKAILALVQDGWLVREKGRGTFVAESPGIAEGQVCRVVVPVDSLGAIGDVYFGTLYWQLQQRLQQHSVRVDIRPLQGGLADAATEPSPAGYIVIDPPESALPVFADLRCTGRPVVLLGCSWNYPGLSFVDSDNLLGGLMAANHLIELGHKETMFLGGCPSDSNTRERLRGFRIALKSRGLDLPEERIVVMDAAWGIDEPTEALLESILSAVGRPTAVFAAGPKIAFALLGITQRLGLRCPDDLSIVAYDDPDFIRLSYPPMTTIRQPLEAMAALAADILLEGLVSGRVESRRHILDPEFVPRGTTSVPPSS